ncbi:hypothetical protein MHW47_02105 [Streptomyces sp. OfavH-34-F]|uniref:hypothetical protein n=1 Tax=Streptomyces sp. OfavH-34-F TaxID=2917760 RepID=UPI001EF17086|nr:hypothetical protein [Streptomyces sp. OfavH-34-F]MCG7523248.1 hypothetical protein [Streptomyces sp. OfavH-34-F]
MTSLSLPARRTATAAIAALVAGFTLCASSTASSAEQRTGHRRPGPARIVGSGDFVLPYVSDSDVRSFSFDVVAAPYSIPRPGIPTGLPVDARGTIRISHYSAEQNVTYTSEGQVECLVTGPNTATVTALITKVSHEETGSLGKRVGLSVYDGGKGGKTDRVGFSWNGVNLLPNSKDAEVGTCMAPAPYAPVVKGGYTVTHAELAPFPRP